MATNLKPRVETLHKARLSESRGTPNKAWEMRLSVGQLVVLWSVLAGTMVMVFLFGLFAGREQGLKTALEEQGGASVRLPIAHRATDAAQQQTASSPGTPSSVGEESAQIAAGKPAPSVASQDLAFDFSNTNTDVKNLKPESLPATEAKSPKDDAVQKAPDTKGVSAGFASKPATQPETDKLSPSVSNLPATENPAVAPVAEPVASVVPAVSVEKAKSEKAKKAEVVPALATMKEATIKEAKTKEPVVVAKKAETAKTSEAAASGWYIQVAAAASASEAQSLSGKLRGLGYVVDVQSAKVGKSTFHRVFVGPFDSRTAAESTRKKIRSSGVVKGEPFLKQIR